MSILSVLGGALTAIIGGNSAKKASNAQAAAAEAQMKLQSEMFDRVDALQGQMYGAQGGTNLRARDVANDQANSLYGFTRSQINDSNRNVLSRLAGARDTSLDVIRNAQQRNFQTLNNARRTNVLDAQRSEQRQLNDLTGARDRAIAGYQPYLGAGQNALGALAYNLGVGDAPNGYQGLQMTPGAQFLMQQGRDTVESGAAGAGGLYSGSTLEALERMRSGIAATDRDNQMAQLGGLAGMGLSATDSVGGLERGFANDMTGVRRWATGARSGARQDFANANTANNAWAAQGTNAVRGLYTPMMVDQINSTTSQRIGNRANLANMKVNAQNLFTSNEGARRMNRANLFGSAAGQYASGGSNALANLGDARAAGAIGVGNSITSGINNALQTFAMMGGKWPGSNQPLGGNQNFWQGVY